VVGLTDDDNLNPKGDHPMKRTHLLALAGGLTAVAFAVPLPARADGANAADIARWSAAWNSHDIDRVVALFSPDVVVDQPSNPKPLNATSLRRFFRGIFVAYPDFHITVEDAVLNGWRAVTIERVTGHWRGPYTNPATGKTAQPNGRAFDHPGAMYIVYKPNHRIKRLRIFWDTLTVDRQLGVKP
jgi:steroid delta-isomerase-like uncharacterized protein